MGGCISSGDVIPDEAAAGLVFGSKLKDIEGCNSLFLACGEDEDHSCKLSIVNNTCNTILYVCWVDWSGKLYHFCPINYVGAIDDGSVSNESKSSASGSRDSCGGVHVSIYSSISV